jgi:hypothetical protein
MKKIKIVKYEMIDCTDDFCHNCWRNPDGWCREFGAELKYINGQYIRLKECKLAEVKNENES